MDVDMDSIQEKQFLKAGTYYATCVAAEEFTGDLGDQGLELRWAAVHPAAAAGRTIRDRLWAVGEHAARLKLACKAVGLRASGQKVTIQAADFIGKRCWITVNPGRDFPDKVTGARRTGYPQIAYDGYDGVTAVPAGVGPSAREALAAAKARAAAGEVPF